MDTLRKSKVLSLRKGALMMEERVVREAVVVGGRMPGLGREEEAGIRIRRWAARVRGARKGIRAVEICILWSW